MSEAGGLKPRARGMCEVLLIEDGPAEGIARFVSGLSAGAENWRLTRVRTIGEAVARGAESFDFVVVFQARPGQFPRDAMGRLYEVFPLARFLVALGPWCGSASRREGVWPESVVVPEWGAAERFEQLRAEARAGVAPLPITASRVEWELRRDARPEWAGLLAGRVIRVESGDPAMRAWLGEVVELAGGEIWPEEGDLAEGVLWDIDPWEGEPPEWLSGERGTPVVALVGLPTETVRRALAAAGVTAVIGKPCEVAEISRALAGT